MTIDLDNIILANPDEEERFNQILRYCGGIGGEERASVYMIIDRYTRQVYGVIEYILSDSKDSIHIRMIEVFEEYRRKGIASYVVKLLNKDYTITGNSVLDALEFWNSLDAEFEEDIYDRDVYEYHKREGLCMPFIIH